MAARVSCDRLGEVAARGGHGADEGRGSFASTERGHVPRALVERGDPARQVRRVAFFSGHLFQAA